jgi:hypothetical protein
MQENSAKKKNANGIRINGNDESQSCPLLRLPLTQPEPQSKKLRYTLTRAASGVQQNDGIFFTALL